MKYNTQSSLLDVALQLVFLEVLQQRAACAVDDRLRHARRARGVQDVERLIERERLQRNLIRRRASQPRVPAHEKQVG